MTLTQLLADIAIYIGFSTFFLLALVHFNPRMMLQDYPPAIQAIVPPKTHSETLQSVILGLPFLLVLLIFPFLFISNSQLGTFVERFLYTFLIIWSFNLWDWLMLDWLLFCKINLKIFVIPGSEHHPAYKDYRFHFRGFLIGTIFSLIMAAMIASLITFKIA